MGWNGGRWFLVVGGGWGYLGMVEDGSWWLGMVKDSKGWCELIGDGSDGGHCWVCWERCGMVKMVGYDIGWLLVIRMFCD